jgi:hypothetical protein
MVEEIIKAAKAENKRAAKSASDEGSEMHQLIFDYLNIGLYDKEKPKSFMVPDKFTVAWANFLEWEENHGVKPIVLEQLVYHSSRFAGRMDFYGSIDGKLVVNDWKYSNGIWPGHVMQSAAYSVAWEEMTKQRVDAVAVTRLDPKTGEIEYHEIGLEERDFEFKKFSALLQYWLLEYSAKLEVGDED